MFKKIQTLAKAKIMKISFFLFIFTTVLMSFAHSEIVSFDQLVHRNGTWYKKFSTTPFTGMTTGIEECTHQNGNKIGLCIRYHPNGQLESQGMYNNKGRMEGFWEFYFDNGQLMTKGIQSNGRFSGEWIWYNKDGSLNKKTSFDSSK
ncbi:hypothetical protein N9Y50_01790 [Alphaproteobacteria bacterium]|nr:hypothetical protein [Alphaproteobacteria bacterium]